MQTEQTKPTTQPPREHELERLRRYLQALPADYASKINHTKRGDL